MENLFLCVVMYDKNFEEGSRKVKEQYIVKAENCAEAEKTVTECVAIYSDGEFKVVKCSEVRYNEIIRNGSDGMFFKGKVLMVILDENSGKEKAHTLSILVEANGIRSALDNADEEMKKSLSDYAIMSMSETPILGIFGM